MSDFNVIDYINNFLQAANTDNHHRYLSFDFCYSYFMQLDPKNDKMHREKSCYVIMSFLASWGMLRGSSVLLRKNALSYLPIIELIEKLKCDDSNCGTEKNKYDYLVNLDIDNSEFINEISKLIQDEFMPIMRELYKKDDNQIANIDTGLTKILMGLFGYPALDTYVKRAFDIKGFKHDSTLDKIKSCYEKISVKYRELIGEGFILSDIKQPIMNFNMVKTGLYYSKAKLMDIYGYEYGYHKSLVKSLKENSKEKLIEYERKVNKNYKLLPVK